MALPLMPSSNKQQLKKGNVQWTSQKMNSCFAVKPSEWIFFKIWDQMRITSFHTLSLKGKANEVPSTSSKNSEIGLLKTSSNKLPHPTKTLTKQIQIDWQSSNSRLHRAFKCSKQMKCWQIQNNSVSDNGLDEYTNTTQQEADKEWSAVIKMSHRAFLFKQQHFCWTWCTWKIDQKVANPSLHYSILLQGTSSIIFSNLTYHNQFLHVNTNETHALMLQLWVNSQLPLPLIFFGLNISSLYGNISFGRHTNLS